MAFNPFIELARDPVATAAWVGYLFLMLGIVIFASLWALRKAVWLAARYHTNRMSDAWWSFGDSRKGYIPPASWFGWASLVCIVLAFAWWALGSIVWMVGG